MGARNRGGIGLLYRLHKRLKIRALFSAGPMFSQMSRQVLQTAFIIDKKDTGRFLPEKPEVAIFLKKERLSKQYMKLGENKFTVFSGKSAPNSTAISSATSFAL